MKNLVVRELPTGSVTAGSKKADDFFAKEMAKMKERTRQRDALYPGDYREKMTALCKSFPSLNESAKGIDPWNTDLFLLWMLTGGGASGCMHAARFVLQVWNGNSDWLRCMRDACKSDPPDPDDSASSKALKLGAQRLVREIRADLEDAERSSAKDYKRTPRPVSDSEVQKALEEYLEKFRPFNVTNAISAWDEKHRRAFVTWCDNAFWP